VSAGLDCQDRPHAEAGAGEVAEHPGQQRVRREIAEKARVLPMRQPRHDQALKVLDHLRERLPSARRLGRQQGAHLAGLGRRHHRARRERLPVVGDQVDHAVPVGTELVRRHGVSSRVGDSTA